MAAGTPLKGLALVNGGRWAPLWPVSAPGQMSQRQPCWHWPGFPCSAASSACSWTAGGKQKKAWILEAATESAPAEEIPRKYVSTGHDQKPLLGESHFHLAGDDGRLRRLAAHSQLPM